MEEHEGVMPGNGAGVCVCGGGGSRGEDWCFLLDRACLSVCLQVLTNLALDEVNRTLISAAGAVPLLVELLRDGSDEGQEAAAGAAENLALSQDVCSELALMGAIPPLVAMIEHGSDTGKETAAGAIENMSLRPDLCPHVVEAGAIAPLLRVRPSRTCSQLARPLEFRG